MNAGGKNLGRLRSKPTGLSAGVSSRSNVIDLSTYRSQTFPSSVPTRIFYVTENKSWLSLFESVSSLRVETIQSQSQLKTKMMIHSPQLVAVDASLGWADCMQLIRDLDYFLEVPILLLCEKSQVKDRSFLVREAYSSGVHDVLFAPFDSDDLRQTLSVLLKFQQSATSI
jgi:DNA-binding response OmpR family regulator